ncbi:hypothetical protein BX600DRAFT_500685 [Xylariales sp. PMI_506]|nr:hypothetical protein BX600DRAFT_500685 [Xylariales sp. PMI_506]
MFNKTPRRHEPASSQSDNRRRMTWDIPILFGLIFALAIAELVFTVDAFIYLQRQNKWWSRTEQARMGFLIFSCARTIFLSGMYVALHFRAVKNLLNTMHTIFLVVSTILWVISGGLIYQIWQYVECPTNGVPNSFEEFKSDVSGGMTLCHEIKTIEIIAWVIAAVSVIAMIPVVMTWRKNRKAMKQQRHTSEKPGAHV